ncbi:N-6 DNA methylase [Stenotrophomonas forensis]|uniref:SAM-dependent methyltransferase n=1 Tax=Stenotrophomonas forensis TaxID=2871169 RepID=A0ABY7Y264_9GAMM|nr:N-6 DNA methylase [Stenotrophomonas sp. DFS-20110405]WDM64077.1 SAM-dependent methyltransferase [Stenotrophomonas sp. DFS-20110405]
MKKEHLFGDACDSLVRAVSSASVQARNEAQLRHEVEVALRAACAAIGIPWTPFQMERALKRKGESTKFIDVAHGGVLIEYEPPRCFAGMLNAKARHARRQVEEYSSLIASEEGRPIGDYLLVAWDGASITFGRHDRERGDCNWEAVVPFDLNSARYLLLAMKSSSKPLVHPKLLQSLIGPDSASGTQLIPALYSRVCSSTSDGASRTHMLFKEWGRLFAQVVGFQPDGMKKLLRRQELSHGQPYDSNPTAYLFALNTYVAIVAKVVVACALPRATQDVLDGSVPVRTRLSAVENGGLYEGSGILNMLDGDFFSWYLDESGWSLFEDGLAILLGKLSGIDFEVVKKDPATTRDLFKGIYEQFIPREIRHALGEFYTPDWLAEMTLAMTDWTVEDSVTDPACGSGTFLLEALRRRLLDGRFSNAKTLLEGINGVDLNPLAVLTAKASLAVFVAPYLNPSEPVRLPVYLADSINPARPDDGLFPSYRYSLSTELGFVNFAVPLQLIKNDAFFPVFRRIRDLIEQDRSVDYIAGDIEKIIDRHGLDPSLMLTLKGAITSFVGLHEQGWNGIWCSIVADRFAAGAVEPASYVCGNPPWIKWSNLPREYTKRIQPLCKELGVFSNAKWVGGIEGDVSTVVAFQAIRTYLAAGGQMCLLMPGSVFETPSSAGFRQLRVGTEGTQCAFERVDDFDKIAPFDGVSNMPRAVLIRKTERTSYPVPYNRWVTRGTTASVARIARCADEFTAIADVERLSAWPVPGGWDRPWIVGRSDEMDTLNAVFGQPNPRYQARKGVTADRNGIFWVKQSGPEKDGLLTITNEADVGKTKGIPKITSLVEANHVFPLLRGRGVSRFKATPDPELRYLVPQRTMHGDPDLHEHSPLAYAFLRNFRDQLSARSSLKRFQKGQAYYSLWTVGDYTFSPYKVLWREIGGSGFEVSYIGSSKIGDRDVVVIPDHKLYFIPVETEDEAAFVTGFLGSRAVSRSVASYGATLSFGVSVSDYIHIPTYDQRVELMRRIAEEVMAVSSGGAEVTEDMMNRIDDYVVKLISQ